MEAFDAPQLRTDFIIVANSESATLAAQVISYLFEAGRYLPFFSFQKVDVAADEHIGTPDIYLLQRRRSEHFSVFIKNVLAENRECDNLIYVGLTQQQRSYLDIDKHFNLLEINDEGDIPNYLGGFAYFKQEPVICQESQLNPGLCMALQQNRLLQIGAFNPDLVMSEPAGNGIVIIEVEQILGDVIAIAYACTIGAAVHFVDQLEKDEGIEVLQLLERWSAGEVAAVDAVKDKINQRIAGLDLIHKDFVTCFTTGLTYGLTIDSVLVSQVHLDYRPDFFIFNAILNEHRERAGSAVVFSTQSFKNEEVTKLSTLLEFENIYQRKILGKLATSYNLKTTIEHYPFDLLHICSHGGRVHGTRCEVDFIDHTGVNHTIEFDHILGIHLTPYEDTHALLPCV